MSKYQLGEADLRFARLIWREEPVASGELVKLCEHEMNWKKSTVYTELRKLCKRGIFINENSIVRSLLSEREFEQKRSGEFIEESYGGSLPKFLVAFMNGRKLTKKEVQELHEMIDRYSGE